RSTHLQELHWLRRKSASTLSSYMGRMDIWWTNSFGGSPTDEMTLMVETWYSGPGSPLRPSEQFERASDRTLSSCTVSPSGNNKTMARDLRTHLTSWPPS